ncbi:Tat pathway signal protein [Streptomyces nigra]|uniref:Tat pathway signal protein n=1 Tax=Streptomyces nigra TaxID=1827580 RepID=UPI0036882987
MPAALAALVSLLASLLTLTAVSPAVAAEECAPLALAPFGDPGDAVGRATVAPDSSVCFTVTVETAGLYLVPALDGHGNTLTRQLLAADGSEVDCHGDSYTTNGMCTVPAAGTYRLRVLNSGWEDAAASVTFVPLGSTRGCADPVGTGWDQPDVTRTTVSRVEVDCQPFQGEPGDRIRLTHGSKAYGDSLAWITDASGRRICERFPEDGEDSCVLPGDGPYRVISTVSRTEQGFPAEYGVKVRRLDDPQGCTAAPVSSFGALERQDLTTNPCFTFTAGAAGPYTVHSVTGDREVGVARVYDEAGLSVCRYGADPCRIKTPGTYTAVLDDGSYPFRDTRAGLVVLDRASDAGCVATGTGPHKGELSTVGQYDCLALDAPQGARIAALTSLSSAGLTPEVEVLDRTGTPQCDESELRGGDCALTGTAPYRALVHTEDGGDSATGTYTVALHRTDVNEGCPVLPAGSFGAGGAKATMTTGGGVFSHCLHIPADAHTDAEIFQLVTTAGTASAAFSVLDSDGKRICERSATTHGWSLCPLSPGKAHTVLVNGRDEAATYTLTRRDVTASASSAGCVKSAATKVGGASVGGAYGDPGTLNCHQVTTSAASDVLHVNVRDALGTANMMVVGGDGTAECSFRNRSCAVTGSTTHQVLVQTPATLKAAPAYRLDALRVATADGPAPECTRVPSVAYGYGPVTGTLDEEHSAMCAVLPTAGYDRFDAEIEDTTGATATAVPTLYDSAWNDGCTGSSSGYRCAAGSSSGGAAPSVFLLGLPDKAAGTSYRARLNCAATPCGPDDVNVTSVGPETAAAGSDVTLTVTGTALPANATVRLLQSGRTLNATTRSVSADNRTLTATFDLTGAATGTWTVSVLAGGREFQRGSLTVTPRPAPANTAAPKVTGTAKTGAKVTAAPGTWSATPTSYTYQWKANGTAISGATAATYTVPAAMVGKTLTVTVTALRSGWLSGSATSAAVTVAKGDAPKATKLPVISGTAKVGRTLKATTATWSPAATSYAYQWYAGGTAISGATKSSLVLKSAQKGKKITVKVIARRTGHKDGSAVSKATAAVAR